MRKAIVVIVGLLAASIQLGAQGWKQIYPAYEAEIYKSILQAGGDTVYLGGYNFTLLRSTNAGKEWQRIYKSLGGYDITRMGFDGAKLVLALGGQKYTDEIRGNKAAGDSIRPFLLVYDPVLHDTARVRLPSYPAKAGVDIEFDISVCRDCIWLYLENGAGLLNRSDDQGTTWRRISTPDSLSYDGYNAIAFRDCSHGLLIASEPAARTMPILYSTSDGGATWARHPEIRFPVGFLFTRFGPPLFWTNDTTAFAISDGYRVYASTDAGSTWEHRASLSSGATSIHVNDAGSGYVTGQSFEVLRTTDHGYSWVPVFNDTKTISSADAVMLRDSVAIVVSTEGFRMRTTDQGLTWDDVEINPLRQLGRMQFFNERDGVLEASLNDGKLAARRYYRTTDGGRTWPREYEHLSSGFVYHTSSTIGFALRGAAQAGDTLVQHTTDAGRTWSLSRSADGVDGIRASLGSHRGDDTVFLCAWSGLLRSYDRGATWSVCPDLMKKVGAGKNIKDLDLSSSRMGWATSEDRIFRSTDDGVTWDSVYASQKPSHDIHILSSQSLELAVHVQYDFSEGGIVETSDGGVTWVSRDLLPADSLAPFTTPVPVISNRLLWRDGISFGKLDGLDNAYFGGGVIRSFVSTRDKWLTLDQQYRISTSNDVKTGGMFFVDSATGWCVLGDRIYFTSTGGIDAAEATPDPTTLTLSQNYPNPFTTHTTIPYSIAGSGEHQLRIELYDAMGRRVATLYDGTATAGEHVLPFDASGFIPGMYFVRLATGGKTEVRKMVVVR